MGFNLLFDEITEICAIYEMVHAVININDYKIVTELYLTYILCYYILVVDIYII